MNTFHVIVTLRSGAVVVHETEAEDTSEAVTKAGELFWPEYSKMLAMPKPTFH